MIQNVTSGEVINILLDIFKNGFTFLLPVIAVLGGIHLVFSMITNVVFRDRL